MTSNRKSETISEKCNREDRADRMEENEVSIQAIWDPKLTIANEMIDEYEHDERFLKLTQLWELMIDDVTVKSPFGK